MTVLNDTYQYIGRSNAANSPGGFQYFVLIYAKSTGDAFNGNHTVSVLTRMACTTISSFYGWGTKGYIKVDGATVKEWNWAGYPDKEWNSSPITEGGATYYSWVDMMEVETSVYAGYAVEKNIVIDTSWMMQSENGSTWLPIAYRPCTASIAVTLPEIVGATEPTVEMTLSAVSSLASPFNELYIQNLTKVDADIKATDQYGADISSCQMIIGSSVYGHPYISDYLTQTGNVVVTGKATDSRGLVGTTEQTITVIPYAKPAIVPADGQTDIVCARCDENGNFISSGTYLRIIAKRSYSPVVSDSVQNNFCQIQYRVDGGNWIPILAGDADGDEIDTGAIGGVVASTTTSYTIDIGVVDTIGNDASVTKIVPTDAVDFSLRLGGKGAAFGEYAENEKELSIAADWTLNIKGRVIGAIFDAIYPVDSIYISYGNKNPSEMFGGTWEQVTNTAIEGTIWRRIA